MKNVGGVVGLLGAAALAMAVAVPGLPQGGVGAPVPAPAAAASSVGGTSATVTVNSGPHKGEYGFSPSQACFIGAFTDKPMGLSVVLNSDTSSLSVDMPNLDEKHANEIQLVLVISDTRAGQARVGASSVTYEIDTRPDAVLKPFQKAERANKGVSGKATTHLMEKDGLVMLTFTGETASGVKLEGSVTCRKVM